MNALCKCHRLQTVEHSVDLVWHWVIKDFRIGLDMLYVYFVL